VFNKKLYQNLVPDNPGGTVSWTNFGGGHMSIILNIDGGTPGFLQVIKTALTIQLKSRWELII
jgi:hypothetical protein